MLYKYSLIYLITLKHSLMKQLTRSFGIRSFLVLVMAAFFQTLALAQDSSVSTNQTTTTSETHTWYTNPWVWVIGGAVFILLLVALIRSNSSTDTRTDKVTVVKTKDRV